MAASSGRVAGTVIGRGRRHARAAHLKKGDESMSMRDVIRVVLVDPCEESRVALQKLLGTITSLWIVEVFTSYQAVRRRIAETAPDLCMIALDADPNQAIELIASVHQLKPEAVRPARQRHLRQRADPQGHPRRGTRVPHPADRGRRAARDRQAAVQRPRRRPARRAVRGPQIIAVTGAAGGVGCTSLAVNLATTPGQGVASTRRSSLDFDLMFGSVDACLDIIPDKTLQSVVQNIDRLDLTLLKRSMTRHASGPLRPAPPGRDGGRRQDRPRDPAGGSSACSRRRSRRVVIDTSKGLQSSDFVAFEMADVILMVIVSST